MSTAEIIGQVLLFAFYLYVVAYTAVYATETKRYALGSVLTLCWTALAVTVIYLIYGD